MQYKNEKTLHLIKQFGQTLQDKRIAEIKKSQTLLAYEYELDSGNLSRIENGNANPSLRTLQRLADGLGMKLKLEFVPA